jgi:hypothetical protein
MRIGSANDGIWPRRSNSCRAPVSLLASAAPDLPICSACPPRRVHDGGTAQIARTLGVGASSVSRALAKKDDETPRYVYGGLRCLRVLMNER